jgi:uncharacterized membrane protein YhiD involved in acid resistance
LWQYHLAAVATGYVHLVVNIFREIVEKSHRERERERDNRQIKCPKYNVYMHY